MIALTFSGKGCNPSASIQCPKYVIEEDMKVHLFLFMWSPVFNSRSSTVSNDFKCSSTLGAVTKMSSKYTTTPGIPCSILSITHWKIPGAAEIPKGKLVYLNNPLWVLITTNFLSQCPEEAVNKLVTNQFL